MDALPDPAPLYPDDAFAWSLAQSDALRRLGAAGLPLPNDLDLPMIIEEIEAVGREQLLAVQGNLTQALLHLVKLALLPEHMASRHWAKETRAFLVNAARRYRPSMRRAVDLDDVWLDVRRLAADEFAEFDSPLPALPAACPLALDALVARDAEPRALAETLAAALH